MGVGGIYGCGYQEEGVGGIYGCGSKEVYRFHNITYPLLAVITFSKPSHWKKGGVVHYMWHSVSSDIHISALCS